MIAIPYDKSLHFIAGVCASTVPALLYPALWWAPALAAFVAGALKESWDYFHPDRDVVDFWDLVATTAGGLPLAITLLAARG